MSSGSLLGCEREDRAIGWVSVTVGLAGAHAVILRAAALRQPLGVVTRAPSGALCIQNTKGVCRKAGSRVAECAERKTKGLMPATLLSSSSLLSGTVLSMLLAWLVCSALLTFRVGVKNRRAEHAASKSSDALDTGARPEKASWLDENEPAGMAGQPLRAIGTREPARGFLPLGFTRGQRAGRHAGPQMVFSRSEH